MHRGEVRLMAVGDTEGQAALAVVALSDRRYAHVWLFAPPYPDHTAAESALGHRGIGEPVMWAMMEASQVREWPRIGEVTVEQMGTWPYPRYEMGPGHAVWWEQSSSARKLERRNAPTSELAEPAGPFSWKGFRAASEYRTLLELEEAPRLAPPVRISRFSLLIEGDDVASDVRGVLQDLVDDGLTPLDAANECRRRLPDYFGEDDTALLAWYALADEAGKAGLGAGELRSLVGEVRRLLEQSGWQGRFKTEVDRSFVRKDLSAWVAAAEDT